MECFDTFYGVCVWLCVCVGGGGGGWGGRGRSDTIESDEQSPNLSDP